MTRPFHRRPLSLQASIDELPLKSPFRIAGYVFTCVPVLRVVLRDRGFSGRGEASGVYYLGDTPARMLQSIEAHRAPIEAGLSRDELRDLLPAGGARNALDSAMWELEARRDGQPAWQLAGLDAVVPRITTFTLGADEPDAVMQAARACSVAQALKLKLDGDLCADARRIRAVREARPDAWLAVDANQGYTLDTLQELMPVLVEARVQLLEQPLPRGREADLDGYRSPIPLAADESVQGLAEVDRLVGRFDVLNIKLDKCGGLTEALLMVRRARELGLRLMVGNMVGTSVAMAPAFVVAQMCNFADLDGPTFLMHDPAPCVTYHDGTIWCGDDVWGA